MEKADNSKYLDLLKQEAVIRLLFANYNFSLIGVFVVASAIFLELYISKIQGSILTEKYLITWYASILLIIILRYGLLIWYNHTKSMPALRLTQFQLFFILSSLTAFAFGMVGSILMPYDIRHQAFILILISGLVGGSVQSLSASYCTNITYVFLTLIPPILWQGKEIFITHSIYIGTFACMIMFCVFSAVVAKRNYCNQIEKIILNFEKELMIKNLENFATHDAMTGLFNRAYLYDYLELEMIRSKRNGSNIAIYMIDIDRFKHINDTYGHEIGDKALKTVASFLKKMVRASDVACRYGGDEFVLALTEITDEVAFERKKELLKATDKLVFKVSDQISETIFLSIGMALYPEDGDTLNKVIKVADDAMYAIKRSKYIQY